MEETFVEAVVALYKQNEWEEVLKLGTKFGEDTVRRVLWVWPSVENLKFIKKHVVENNLDGVTSIGCGCGLLEWILQEFSSKCLFAIYSARKTMDENDTSSTKCLILKRRILVTFSCRNPNRRVRGEREVVEQQVQHPLVYKTDVSPAEFPQH